jgi:hypothetical protein
MWPDIVGRHLMGSRKKIADDWRDVGTVFQSGGDFHSVAGG